MSGALLGLSFVLTGAGRTVPNGEWIAWASPIHYFELSKPLIPTYGVDPTAMIVLAALSVTLSALSVALFVRRDVGAPVALALPLLRAARAAGRRSGATGLMVAALGVRPQPALGDRTDTVVGARARGLYRAAHGACSIEHSQTSPIS